MRPDRIAARFISGGRHQSFKSIATSPFKLHTVTSGKNRRQQYQALKRREQRAATAQKRKAQREAAAQKRAYARRAAELKKLAPKPPRKPRVKSPPIAVNPRTGKPITLAQAMKSLKDAQDRADRLAAGLPGDPPAKKTDTPRAAAAKKPAAKKAAPRKRAAKKTPPPPPPPPAVPGKNLRGLYLAATCACQGTGRIYTEKNGMIAGSVSCPEHGRAARGGRKITSRRAVKNAGLPGLASWLETKASAGRGNLDKKQQRAADRADRKIRYAGPTEVCGACDDGIVNRELTDQLRARYIARIVADRDAAGRKPLGARKLEAMARKAYPYDHCRACRGLAVIPDPHAGAWLDRAQLHAQHQPTARELATGRVVPGRRT
jgi:hypothetical protein